MRHANKVLGVLVLAVVLLGIGYVLAYGLMLDNSPEAQLRNVWSGEPSYRWQSAMANTLFAPVHWLDRQVRPERWRSKIPIFL